MEDTTIEAVLKTVEGLYAQKNYEGALLELQKNHAQVPEAIWHFNMGTTYAKLEKWPSARFHFLMAESRDLVSAKLTTNKSIVEEKIGTEKLEQPFAPGDYFVRAGLLVAEGMLTLVSLLFLVGGLLMLWRKRSVRAFALCLAVTVTALGLNLWIERWHRFVVIDPQTILDGPSAIFASRGEVPAGVFLISSPEEGWLRIIYPSRFEGWIKPTGVKEVK